MIKKDVPYHTLNNCQLSVKQIAPDSPRSVEAYRDKLMEKIGAENVVGIVLYAIKHGIYKL